ncbi:MAG: APC family permease [Actinomycetes bacterium]
MASTEAAAGSAATPAKTRAVPSVKTITWLTMCFMTVSAVASIRNTPSMAVYGLACIFLYALPAVVFLLPTSLVAAELASGWDGGVYNWVSQGISPQAGFLAIWTQFAMTLTYYPSLLAYVASTLAYVFMPSLASNGYYTAAVIIIVYWVSTLVSMRGVGIVAKLSSSSMLLGTAIPGSALILLGIIYLVQGNHSAAPMNVSHLLPQFAGLASLVLIVNNFLSYAGMEVNAVHVKSMKNPGKEFPKAMFIAMPIVVAIFVLPALAISWVVPASELTLTGGVMQAFTAFFTHFHVEWLTPILGIMLITASLGGMMAWLAGPSKGLLLIGRKEGYLPPFFQKVNAAGIQVNILFVQGAIVSVIALMFALIPNVSSVYWIFSVITTQVYLIMYFLMFISVMRLRRTQPDHPRGYRAPMVFVLATVGFVSAAAAFLIGFVPSSQFGSGSTLTYVAIIGGGLVLIGLAVPFLFLWLRKPSWKNAVPAPEAEQD